MMSRCWGITDKLRSQLKRAVHWTARLVPTARLCLWVALLPLAFPGTAAADVVYVAASNADFGTIDVTTGTFTPIGTLAPLNGFATTMFGMGFVGSTLYGLDNQPSAHLYTINPSNANTTDLGAAMDATGGTYDAVGGTAFGGKIYGMTLFNPNAGTLYTVSPSALVSVIGNTGLTNPDGLMAFDASGTLFTDSAGTTGDELFSVNPSTAAATDIGNMGHAIFAGVFSNGILYGFSDDGNIYTINTTTAATTLVASYRNNGLEGQFIDSVAVGPAPTASFPEPSTAALLGVAALCLFSYAARRQAQHA